MKYTKTLLAAILLTITFLAFSNNANAGPRFEVVIGSPVVAGPVIMHRVWVRGHYRRISFHRVVWVPGHWRRI